jgi:hypothetical protein
VAAMEYAKMARMLTRCAEIADSATVKPLVRTTYLGMLEAPALSYLNAQHDVIKVESAQAKEANEAANALEALDQPYRETRSVVKAFVPTINVPMTLKQLPTDTDRLNAIGSLLDIVNDYKTTPWGMDLANGSFAQNAAAATKEFEEAIAANKKLGEARMNRAAAFDPAYAAYLRFKQVVRDAYGPTSVEYKRIHLRASPAGTSDTVPPSTPG